ncbi:hypothetical protein [Moritella dasanensis]|uniref:hypothetical protein n=1 Tax=Moritella dasanensis TaxID=428031 RepID=UPI0002FC4C57|nr:hypothetical protein [Moritella dasanensis]
MRATENIIIQMRRSVQLLSSTYIMLGGLLFSITMISGYYNIPISSFTRDPTVVLGGPSYVGFISNIGMLFWAFTAAICLFSSVIHKQGNNKTTSQFLLYSGLLTLWLLLDDMFMLHDSLLPNHLMIPEKLVYLGYVVMVLVYLVKFRTEILSHEYATLFIAFSFFALSVLADLLLEQQGYEFLLEDGFKLFGIVTWFIFFFRTCRAYLQQEGV